MARVAGPKKKTSECARFVLDKTFDKTFRQKCSLVRGLLIDSYRDSVVMISPGEYMAKHFPECLFRRGDIFHVTITIRRWRDHYVAVVGEACA